MNLTTQDEQVECFQNAAAHLAPGGCFVIEVGVPDLQRLPPGETFHPFHVGESHLGLDDTTSPPGLVSHHYQASDGGFQKSSVPFRYVWPSELDLMARLAGMRLRERWGDWIREPFTVTAASTSGSGRSRRVRPVSVVRRTRSERPVAPKGAKNRVHGAHVHRSVKRSLRSDARAESVDLQRVPNVERTRPNACS